MKAQRQILALVFAIVVSSFALVDGADAQSPQGGASPTAPSPAKTPQLNGGRHNARKEFDEDGALRRITGKAGVLDAHTIVFDDGTEVDLNGIMEAPDLEQKASIDGVLYPCGREAAEFLKGIIGDQAVTFLSFGGKGKNPRGNCVDNRNAGGDDF